MLSFNVAQLLKQGIGATRHRELSGEIRDIDENNPEPVWVEGEVDLLVTPEGILVTGTAHMVLTRACRRCLELTASDVVVDIEEQFYPTIEVITGKPWPVDHHDEPELLIDEHHILDLTEVLRQYAVAETVKPVVCREDCLGLCPVCGANRNIEPCNCHLERIDPRLAALAQLLESEDE